MGQIDGLRYLLDTNIVIGILKNRPAVVELVKEKQIRFDEVAVSQITRIELLSFPQLADEEESQIQAFLDECTVILCDEVIEVEAIALRRSHGFKLPDAIIAATARLNGLELMTLDQKMRERLSR